MYKAPVDEIAFTLKHVAGMADALQSGALGDLGEDLVDAILSEAGRFATEEVAPSAISATVRARASSEATFRRRMAGVTSITTGSAAAGMA